MIQKCNNYDCNRPLIFLLFSSKDLFFSTYRARWELDRKCQGMEAKPICLTSRLDANLITTSFPESDEGKMIGGSRKTLFVFLFIFIEINIARVFPKLRWQHSASQGTGQIRIWWVEVPNPDFSRTSRILWRSVIFAISRQRGFG